MNEEEADEYVFGRELSDVDKKYINELTAYGYKRLVSEPKHLRKEKEKLQKRIENVTFDNISTFLQTSETVDKSEKLVNKMQNEIDSILSNIPILLNNSDEYSNVINKTKQLRQKRKENRLISQHHIKILEILEMPQLMWKCARAKLYEEALDLKLFAENLYLRHKSGNETNNNNNSNNDITILKSIIDEMNSTNEYIYEELLSSLEKSIQLPQCLRVIGYLRRMNVFDNELLLRKEFLQRRLKYLKHLLPIKLTHYLLLSCNNDNNMIKLKRQSRRISQINENKNDSNNMSMNESKNDEMNNNDFGNISSTQAYEYLCKFFDVYRINIFSIVTQYRAIFVDTSIESSFTQDLLTIWVHQRVIEILNTVEKLLRFVETGSFLNSIAQTCDYCGQSLSHVGIDFRGLLPSIFEKRIISLFKQNCNLAIMQFESALTSQDWFVTVDILSKLGVKTDDHRDKMKNDDNDDNGNENGNGNGAPIAPQIILQYPPLAILTNGIIKAFNELREFVTYSTMLTCKKILISTIESSAESIRKYSVSSYHYRKKRKTIAQSKNSNEKKIEIKNENENKNENKNKNENDEKTKEKKNEKENNNNKMDENEMDDILSNLVKVECEYLLAFVCDTFDMIFECTNEISVESLLKYFVGLYEPPQFSNNDEEAVDTSTKQAKEEKANKEATKDVEMKQEAEKQQSKQMKQDVVKNSPKQVSDKRNDDAQDANEEEDIFDL